MQTDSMPYVALFFFKIRRVERRFEAFRTMIISFKLLSFHGSSCVKTRDLTIMVNGKYSPSGIVKSANGRKMACI